MTAVPLNPSNRGKQRQYLWKQHAVWYAFLARISHFPLLVYAVFSFNYGISGTIALLLSDPESHRLNVSNAKNFSAASPWWHRRCGCGGCKDFSGPSSGSKCFSSRWQCLGRPETLPFLDISVPSAETDAFSLTHLSMASISRHNTAPNAKRVHLHCR